MTSDITINQLDPNTFEYQTYMSADENLIASSDLDTVFSSLTDYIEYYIYDQNQTLVYPFETVPLVRYDIREGDVILNPVSNLEDLGFDVGSYNILYSFYRKRLSSNISEKYFISEISSDRTEIRLDSNTIANELIISSTNDFIEYRETAEYFVDFYLNFGNNQTVIANNVKLETDENLDPTVLIKLYEPLPTSFDVKDELWVVELLSKPQAYEINFVFEPEIEQDFTYIQGPNYSLDIVNQTATSGEQFSYSTLVNSDITSSINQIQSLLNEKEININVDYEDYNNFVNFSSAKTRLENFYYKAGLIESYNNEISTFLSQITSDTTTTLAYSSSKAQLTGKIDDIIKNFDGYEYFLYFNSGSQYSYPKQNTEPPFQLYPTGSTEALTWVNNQALSASNYDQDNRDWLYWSIPEYLREDSSNQKYELFVDMVGQYYDNVWVYTKDISNKFDADNRLSYGISKDLVADAIKDFGVKLYSNNFNTDDLFTAFLGLTPSGSAFPFPNITGSLPVESGYEYVDTKISASNDIVPQDDVNKSLYKRIYHNIPYLLKTKGTVAGLRALITSYGIPDTILRISEFGGKDRNEAQDYDLKQDVFNYAFDTGASATNYLTSLVDSNDNFPGGGFEESPRSIQLRFKPASIPLPTNNVANSNIRYSQSLWSNDQDGYLLLEYTGSGYVTGSYSGSIPSPYDNYGTLKFIPDADSDPSISASVYLPFFNDDWWSVQVNINTGISTSTLFVANEIDGKVGFNKSSSISGFDGSYWFDSTIGNLNYPINITPPGMGTYKPFSGSFQELRYWVQEPSQSNFYDFTVNPYSVEGNGVNGTPSQLYFRAALGTQLDTGSRTSIHPRVTGSATQITSSFNGGDSSFTLNGEKWVTNVENIFQDQVPAGIKNRITNKIQAENLILAEAPYGISGSTAVISSENNDTTTISALKSIQQQSFVSQSYTPSVNYLEVGFSPSNQINDDINAQLGYFNLGDYIGDPRFISSSDTSYPDLDRLRDAYFEKYMASYDIVDFIRLIKFFDNSLFKMIKDFTPARTSLASGVVVKQHLLERNRQRPAQAESSTHDYSGSIKPFVKDYNTGSADQPQYATSGSAIYKFSGGAGGVMNRYNGLQTSPSASAYGLTNKFGPLTQSYEKTLSGPLGQETVTIFNQDEFYNGVFSGSDILVQNGNLNPDCDPYLKVSDTAIFYKPLFFNLTQGSFTRGTTTSDQVIFNTNNPFSGDAWILSKQVQSSPIISKVQYIKLSKYDINNINVGDYLDDSTSIKIILPDANVREGSGVVEYFIDGVTVFSDSTLLKISQDKGDNIRITKDSTIYYPITSSTNGGSENWSLSASGDFSTSNGVINVDNEQQGNFVNPNALNQQQLFWFYNGEINDELGFFNTGSESENLNNILSDPAKFNFGTYNPQRTSNIPWYFSCSIEYSSSNLNVGGVVTQDGIYHSASKYSGPGLTNQNFNLVEPSNLSGVFKPSPEIVNFPSSDIFNINYNTQIPGDSGSAAGLIGGHPKINLAGTASMDFHFPSLKIGGTPRSVIPPTATFRPFSGSLVSSNDNFEMDDFNNFFKFSGSTAASIFESDTDGAMYFTFSEVNSTIGTSTGRTNISTQYLYLYIDIVVSGSVPFTIQLKSREYDSNDPWHSELGFEFISSPDGSNGNIIQEEGAFLVFPQDFNEGGSPTIDGFEWRWEVKAQNSTDTEMDYYISTYNCTSVDVGYTYLALGFTTFDTYTETPGWKSPTSGFHGSPTNKQTHTFNATPSGDAYPQIDIRAELRRTGSGIPPEGYLITASNTLVNEEIFGGKTFTWGDSPIRNIFNDIPSTNADSTRNNKDDMYYVVYSMSNYDVVSTTSPNENFSLTFLENGDPETKILITQSAVTDASGFDLTGSLFIAQGNSSNPSQIGPTIVSQEFIVPDATTSNERFTMTGSFTFPFKFDDAFRMGVSVDKSFTSGLTITEYTMSIFPSESIYSPLPNPTLAYDNYKTPIPTGFIIPTYFGESILPFNLALDCQPLLNNYNEQRSSTFLMDVDYSSQSGPIIPVNQTQILSNSAVKATVPDSNYTQLRSINPRYNGVKSTSAQLNVWNIGDIGTFGKLPTVELRDAFFGYFNDLDDPYPNINGLTRVNLNYLIDEQGNALPPSLEPLSIDTFKAVFPNTTLGKIAVRDINSKYQDLGSPSSINRTMEYVTPICYSQNSGENYSNTIPLSGSGYISRYDNDDSTSVDFAQFMAAGTASIDTVSQLQEVSYTLNPSETNISPAGASSPYTASSGIASYPTISWGTDDGDDLNNEQIISLQTSVVTTYVSETNRTDNELTLRLQMLYGQGGNDQVSVPFNLESINCKVYTDTGQVYLIKDVDNYGWFTITNVVDKETTRRRKKNFWGRSRWVYSSVAVPIAGIKCSIDWEMFETLFDLGLMRKRSPKNGAGIKALEWIFSANSGKQSIKSSGKLSWKIIGSFKDASKGYQQGYFFPTGYTGEYTPVKIQGAGVYDHLLANANTAQAPFWVSSSANNDNSFTTPDQSILVMTSSNFNEAYGTGFYQGDLPYFPGTSQYFPGNVEPKGTGFDKIENPLEIIEGDEIRFANNENFTYRVLEVFTPQENVVSGNGYLKLKLDRDVDTSINKDFFLVRRKVVNPNSLYLDTPFPYGILTSASISTGIVEYTGSRFALTGSIITGSGGDANLSGSYTASYSDLEIASTPGILYPDFPTEYLVQSASIIVNDLISKGIIES